MQFDRGKERGGYVEAVTTVKPSETVLSVAMLEEAKILLSGCSRETVGDTKKCLKCKRKLQCLTRTAPERQVGDMFYDGSNQVMGVVVESNGSTATVKIS